MTRPRKGKMLVEKQSPTREYELTYVFGTGYTTAEVNALIDSMTALIGKNGGEIIETADWGKKSLAYPIKKDGKTHQEGSYQHVSLKLTADKALDLKKNIQLKKEIIRSLLICKN